MTMQLLPHPLTGHARARPQHTALCDGVDTGSLSVSYQQLAQHSARVAAFLISAGVQPKDRVALVGPHTLEFAAVLHGIGWLGAVAVPLPTAGTPEALAARVRRSEAKVCIALAATPQERQHSCAQALGRPCLVWPPVSTPTPDETPDGSPGAAPLSKAASWHLDAPLLVLETSGTSGAPTQVLLTAQQILMQSLGSATRLGHAINDMWLNVLPLHHVGGLMILYRALIFGASVCVPGRFEAQQMATLMQEGPVTLTSVVPTMLARLLPHFAAKPCGPGLRAVLLGGAPTPAGLHQEAVRLAVPVLLTWGMTEAASGVCVRWPQHANVPSAPHGVSNAGPPLPFVEVWADAEGALNVAGPTVGGALRTGDRGKSCDDGTVTILGRRDRVIISGGENIAPEEVEAVLLSHAAIFDACVVGAPDPLWGERPVAHLVARGDPVPSHELVGFCRARLASFQIPVRFVWHAQLPRDAMGKLQRTALTEPRSRGPQ